MLTSFFLLAGAASGYCTLAAFSEIVGDPWNQPSIFKVVMFASTGCMALFSLAMALLINIHHPV